MNFKIFAIALSLLLVGCGEESQPTTQTTKPSKLEEERQRNMAAVNAAPVQEQKESAQWVQEKKQEKPLRSFNDALEATLDISDKNPNFLNYILQTASSDDIAMCAAIGMKVAAFSAVNPDALDGAVVKVHALNAAGMSKSYQLLVDKGAINKGAMMMYVNIFNPLFLGDILEKNWAICDRVMARAIKLIDQNELTSFLRRPYVK